MSDSGRMIGECEHGYQRWHCETCKLRAVADRLADKVAEALQGIPPAAGTLRLALDEYRKAVAGG